MCEPTTMAALAIATTAAQQVSQYQQVSAHNKAVGRAAQAQADQKSDELSQQANERARKARQERARLRVAAGEAGVAGQSQRLAIEDSKGRQNRDAAVVKKQALNADRALKTRTKQSAKSFSPVSAGLQIASAGASGYKAGGGNLKDLNPFG